MITFGDLLVYLKEQDCCGDLRFTKQFCEENDLDFSDIKDMVEETGGYCDCEVLFNSSEKINPIRRLK